MVSTERAEDTDETQKIEGKLRRIGIFQFEKTTNDGFGAQLRMGITPGQQGAFSFVVGAVAVVRDSLQGRCELVRQLRSGDRFEQENGQLPVSVRVIEDRADVVAKVDAHKGGCGMAIPVAGPEVGIAAGKLLQGVEERPGLVGSKGFGIAVPDDGIGIGRDAAEGQDLAEMRDPCVQTAQ